MFSFNYSFQHIFFFLFYFLKQNIFIIFLKTFYIVFISNLDDPEFCKWISSESDNNLFNLKP